MVRRWACLEFAPYRAIVRRIVPVAPCASALHADRSSAGSDPVKPSRLNAAVLSSGRHLGTGCWAPMSRGGPIGSRFRGQAQQGTGLGRWRRRSLSLGSAHFVEPALLNGTAGIVEALHGRLPLP
jgi:hypothetical protein